MVVKIKIYLVLQDVSEHHDPDRDQLRGVHLPGGQHHSHWHCPGQPRLEDCLLALDTIELHLLID